MLTLQIKTFDKNGIDMDLKTSLSGRLRNTTLPKSSALFPLFEAIVNSIHAIDERVEQDKTLTLEDCFITIKIIRSSQTSFDSSRKPEIVGFQIIDNGVGFNDKNYTSFYTLDSEYKAAKGCKGIGRLLWLKAFSSVAIESYFSESGKTYKRTFSFTRDGLSNEKLIDIQDAEIHTSVSLNNMLSEYAAGIPKSADKLADKIIDHCFWYFLREGGAPHIVIEDGNDCSNLNNIFEYSKSAELATDTFEIRGNEFEVTHIKLREGSPYRNSALYGAANRLVLSESLEAQIQGLYGELNDEKGAFDYVCFVSSPYLTNNVSPERLNFNISEKLDNSVLSEVELAFSEIRNGVINTVASFLSDYLAENLQRTEDRIVDFVNTKEPRYRSIIKYLTHEDKAFNPNIKDSQLEMRLHKRLMEVESELMAEGRILIHADNIDDAEYQERLNNYLGKAADSKASDLASYVTKRRVILDLLERALEIQDNGKYPKEEVVHQLIMPMRETSESILSEEYANLWLIDERLAFHTFLASDKTIKSMPITSDISTTEPDLCALNIYNNPLLVNESSSRPLASITIVELKRPMRDNAKAGEKDDPIEQALNYLIRIRQGNATDPKGRPIPAPNDIPGFCYIICDITPTVRHRCDMMGFLQETQDKMGYFGYHSKYKAYVEVISFTKLVQQAKERNRMFFQKLGIPTGL